MPPWVLTRMKWHVLQSAEGEGMRFTHWWSSEKARKNRARAARKPKIRWEMLGLPRALDTGATTSMDDIRQQVSHTANSWLEPRPMTQGRPPSANPAPTTRGCVTGI